MACQHTIVGLPDAAVQESRERVQMAIKNAGQSFPRRRMIVNLAQPRCARKARPMTYPSHWGVGRYPPATAWLPGGRPRDRRIVSGR